MILNSACSDISAKLGNSIVVVKLRASITNCGEYDMISLDFNIDEAKNVNLNILWVVCLIEVLPAYDFGYSSVQLNQESPMY